MNEFASTVERYRHELTGQSEEVVWLGPIPNSVLEPTTPPAQTPEVMTLMRETIEIAFLTAIQRLTPQQRAALILCHVLDWSAKDAKRKSNEKCNLRNQHYPGWLL